MTIGFATILICDCAALLQARYNKTPRMARTRTAGMVPRDRRNELAPLSRQLNGDDSRPESCLQPLGTWIER